MAYTGNFGKTSFVDPISNESILVCDTTKAVKIDSKYYNDPRYYFEYTLKDGDRFDLIAYRFYDDPDLWWLIVLFNQMFNVTDQYPVDDRLMNEYIAKYYWLDDPSQPNHYVDLDGNIVSPLALKIKYKYNSIEEAISKLKLTPVLNYDLLRWENDQKRNIKLLHPDLIATVKKQLEQLFRQSLDENSV